SPPLLSAISPLPPSSAELQRKRSSPWLLLLCRKLALRLLPPRAPRAARRRTSRRRTRRRRTRRRNSPLLGGLSPAFTRVTHEAVRRPRQSGGAICAQPTQCRLHGARLDRRDARLSHLAQTIPGLVLRRQARRRKSRPAEARNFHERVWAVRAGSRALLQA